jgi:MFS family permease
VPIALAGALVFVSSAAVLVLEILAGRLLAPYVGVTLETFTGIIGTVLAGIAIGTWAGGRLADRIEPRRLLGPLLAVGGGLAIAGVPLVRVVGGASDARGHDPLLTVALAMLGFLAPAAVLSAVAPTVVKLQLHDLRTTGTVVGRLSAVGTAGALFGTFITGFVLVSAVPTQAAIVGVGSALVALGVVLWLTLWRREPGVMAAGCVVALFAVSFATEVDDPCHAETTYFCARVEVDPARPSARVLRLDNLRHSYVDLTDPRHLEFRYTRLFADVIDTVTAGEGDAALDALHIGGGGFTMPRWLATTRPGSRSIVLELDPGIVELARERLGLVTGPDLDVRVGDARLRLRGVPEGSFDLAVGDAFGGLSVPWHLTTREFVDDVHRRLREGGTYLLNLIDHGRLSFVRAEVATLATVFDSVTVILPPGPVTAGGNVVVAATDAVLDVDRLQQAVAARGERVLSGDALDAFVDGADVLTDDHAPVDQLLEP